METVENPYKYRSRSQRTVGGGENVAVSALHEDPDDHTGAVAVMKGGQAAHEGRTERRWPFKHVDHLGKSHTDYYGTPEQIWVDEDAKREILSDDSNYDDFHKANQRQTAFEHRHGVLSQGTLFDTVPAQEAKAPTLTDLASTKGESHLVPALLGHVGLESMRRYGVLPVPDESLSTDSSRMVQRLVNHGIIQPNPRNPESLPTNNVGRVVNGHSSWADVVVSGEKRTMATILGGYNPYHATVSDLDPNVGSQFAREQLVAAKKSREGQ